MNWSLILMDFKENSEEIRFLKNLHTALKHHLEAVEKRIKEKESEEVFEEKRIYDAEGNSEPW